jgi:hypothetical protein
MGTKEINGWAIEINVHSVANGMGIKFAFETSDVYADKDEAKKAMEFYAEEDTKDYADEFIGTSSDGDWIVNKWESVWRSYHIVSKTIKI